MYRSEEDLALLAELAGVLDQTVAAGGLTAGSYLVLRELARLDAPTQVSLLAQRMHEDGDEVADMSARLVRDGHARMDMAGLVITEAGRDLATRLEEQANQAIGAYVLERPHTATVYGLVAAMRAGRFTVEDLIEFLQGGSGEFE